MSQWVPGYGPTIEITEKDLDTLLSAPFERYVQRDPETGEPGANRKSVFVAKSPISICLRKMTVADFYDKETALFGAEEPVDGTHDTDRIQWQTSVGLVDEKQDYADLDDLILEPEEKKKIKDQMKEGPTWTIYADGSSGESEWDPCHRQASLGSIKRADKKSSLCINLSSSRKPWTVTRGG